MTPFQFAKEQCSNFNNGACAGIGIKDDGSAYCFGAKPACVLGTRGVRCEYFEQCVLPMDIEPCNARNIIRRQEQQDMAKMYRRETGAAKPGGHTGRICPQCQHRELEPRRRLCYECASQNKRQAKHGSLTGVVKLEKPSISLGNTHEKTPV